MKFVASGEESVVGHRMASLSPALLTSILHIQRLGHREVSAAASFMLWSVDSLACGYLRWVRTGFWGCLAHAEGVACAVDVLILAKGK